MIRRLPPSLTKEELEEQLQPLPDVDYLEFFSNDTRWLDVVGGGAGSKLLPAPLKSFNLSWLFFPLAYTLTSSQGLISISKTKRT